MIDTKSSMIDAVREAYHLGQEDETLDPIVGVDCSGEPVGRIRQGDSVIFYDIRGEREIEITRSLTEKNFSPFPVAQDLMLNFVSMIEYSSALDVKVAFPLPRSRIKNTFAEVVTQAGLRLLKITESEKAIHMSYFMNGKAEAHFPGEEMIVVPSPEGVRDYAQIPEMSVENLTAEIFRSLQNPDYQLIISNLANVDVVGHCENKKSVLRAVEAVDRAMGQIAGACLKQKISLAITADHGTVEEWLYPDGKINTGHTKNDVPFILVDDTFEGIHDIQLKNEGELADVAPTLLEMLGIAKPGEMTGESLLLNFTERSEQPRRLLLLILDGWGIREENYGNLIREAHTPHFDRLWEQFPHAFLKASGVEVGMPEGTVGNSEAGHLHIGAGRRILLDRVKIDRAIESGNFFKNEAFLWAINEAKKKNKCLHLMGIVSHFSSHGTIDHLLALLQMAQACGIDNVYIHALIGRRGERPESGAWYIGKVEEYCRKFSVGKVVTIMGRFWALDREENWDRVEKAYRALVYGEGRRVRIK
jgi:2,3-bisphosphoglycerate-independent phosphoglycerate mutase